MTGNAPSVFGEGSQVLECRACLLPHLVEALSQDAQPEFQPLKQHVNQLFESWRPRSVIPAGPYPITRDPMPDQVLDLWPQGKKILGKLSDGHFRHIHLLYSYRNALAHELRERGRFLSESDVLFPYTSVRLEVE